jgi:hypothetical protein
MPQLRMRGIVASFARLKCESSQYLAKGRTRKRARERGDRCQPPHSWPPADSGHDLLVATQYAGIWACIMMRSVMFPFRLFAATGDAVAQLDSLNGETVVSSLNLEGRGVTCVTVPTDAS